MSINKNHEFEELDGIKCAVVEKNVTPDRVAFLKDLLQYNSYQVVVVPSPAAKAAVAAVKEDASVETLVVLAPETFTVAVTDVRFNAINAVFGRLLHAKNGQVVTLAYWKQESLVNNDDIPYFDK